MLKIRPSLLWLFFLTLTPIRAYTEVASRDIPEAIIHTSFGGLYVLIGLAIIVVFASVRTGDVLSKKKRNVLYLYIGLFLFFAGVYSLTYENPLANLLFGFTVSKSPLASIAFYSLPIPLLLIFAHIIPGRGQSILYGLSALHLLLALLSIGMPIYTKQIIEILYSSFLVLLIINFITLFSYFAFYFNKKNRESHILFAGLLFAIASQSLYFIVTDQSNTTIQVVRPFGLFLFIGALVTIVVRRFILVVTRQTKYSHLLERSVKSRTRELDASLKEMQRDLNTARKFQQKMLPDIYELRNGPLQIAARYLPLSIVGGDIYLVAKLPNNVMRFFIADAAGHGLEAALVTIAIKGEFEVNSPFANEPHELLELLNSKFVQKYRSLTTFFSAVVCDIDYVKHKLSFASAGHPAQLLSHAGTVKVLRHTGPLVGVLNDITYQQHTHNFRPGDSLLLFTDGILEQTRPKDNDLEEFGEKRLVNILSILAGSDATDIADIVETELLRFTDEIQQDDDVTLITVSY